MDEFDAVVVFDAEEFIGERGVVDAVRKAAVEDGAAVEAIFGGAVGCEEGSEEDVALDLGAVLAAGDEAVEDGADAADFLDRFMGDVYDSFHECSFEQVDQSRISLTLAIQSGPWMTPRRIFIERIAGRGSSGWGGLVRFRQVDRGRQAVNFERSLLTVQQNEYLVSLFPGTYGAEQLKFVAESVNTLDEHRFSVVPFLKTKAGAGLRRRDRRI